MLCRLLITAITARASRPATTIAEWSAP